MQLRTVVSSVITNVQCCCHYIPCEVKAVMKEFVGMRDKSVLALFMLPYLAEWRSSGHS